MPGGYVVTGDGEGGEAGWREGGWTKKRGGNEDCESCVNEEGNQRVEEDEKVGKGLKGREGDCVGWISVEVEEDEKVGKSL